MDLSIPFLHEHKEFLDIKTNLSETSMIKRYANSNNAMNYNYSSNQQETVIEPDIGRSIAITPRTMVLWVLFNCTH